MDFTISEKVEPTICLNMIVKNESHIIQETLRKLCDKISFSYWVVCDTGSTDDTPKIIEEFFKTKQISGEMFYDEWKNFSHNRTLALNRAFKKTDLLLVFDADDEIVGEIKMPKEVLHDEYHLQFGSEMGSSYTRVLLINNQKPFEYKSVIHEFITCKEPNTKSTLLEGNYYVVSGRSSARNKDPEKYLKDAKILEKAFEEAKAVGDDLFHRYAFYCANSYKDYGSFEEAIKWYKVVLTHQGQWAQEKYMACVSIYECFSRLNQTENGFFYLVNAFAFDRERVECLFHLVNHYCSTGMNETAYYYYLMCKDFYENRYLSSNIQTKLFAQNEKYDFLLPFYMILVCDKVKGTYPEANKTISKMFEIIFTKKIPMHHEFFIGNLLYNLQFFINIAIEYTPNFLDLFQSYIHFLESININLAKHDFLKLYEPHGIVFKHRQTIATIFSKEECEQSNKILIYAGFSNKLWNYTYSLKNGLGGSETAVCNLVKCFPKSYEIYVGGNVEEESIDNIHFVNFGTLDRITKEHAFHTLIVSRYIAFYEMFPHTSFYQSFIWGHDIILFNYGCNLEVNQILDKWSDRIHGCVCQTEWHAELFKGMYPQLTEKMRVINNGIEIEKFSYPSKKIENRFIYSSCSERGLDRLLELWPDIIQELPNSELYICSYNAFPSNEYENSLNSVIQKYDNIKHVGCLNRDTLYELMSTCEYWLYPTNFSETSCITSMEMLMSEVICIYYPLAGLVNTLGDYGISVSTGNEVETIINLTNKKKSELRKRGKNYAVSCSWENRFQNWSNIMFETQTKEKPNFPIKVINLKRREDRKSSMTEQFARENVTGYEFVDAVDGKHLAQSEELRLLFEGNDFNYKKGVIGCSLSHISLWNRLISDSESDFYVILEDDIQLCKNFKEKLEATCEMFRKQNIDHLSLGNYSTNSKFNEVCEKLEIIETDPYHTWNSSFSNIISKNAAKKIIEHINSCSIKVATDNPQAYGNRIKYYGTTYPLVKCEMYSETFVTDIQGTSEDNFFIFDNVAPVNESNEISISFCDWWTSEYCGGNFEFDNNFITRNLSYSCKKLNIRVVPAEANPDILFYSIFGNSHKGYNAGRKVFFSGEPYGCRDDADYNLTFDDNNVRNTRFPLWLAYTNDYLLHESLRRKNGELPNVPNKEKFCSFIASGPGLTNNRKEFVEKLSRYKKVDCGGNYLNNIGASIPLGTNCSGKVEHNNKYKFAVAFESTNYPGYVTEKICDVYKSNCIPIYWGTNEVVRDFNPSTFINANDFDGFDKLIEHIIKVDNDCELYASYFREPVFSNKWMDVLNDPNKTFYKNLADCIIGKSEKLLDNFMDGKFHKKVSVSVFNIWHNKLFDKCYEKLDEHSLNKITMYDVNENYEKIYNHEKKYKIVKECQLQQYNSLYQNTNYCQTSCLYHVFKNNLHLGADYIGFIQYDMELEKNFIYDIEEKINKSREDIYFYCLNVAGKEGVHLICNPYENSVLEKYNKYFNTNHTLASIRSHKNSEKFICLHTFVIPTQTFIKMMTWFCTLTDWLHANYINGLYAESMSEVTEEIFGLFLLLQMIENDYIQFEQMKLHHQWPSLHDESNFNNYKERLPHFSLDKIVDNRLTDKNTWHSYLDTYESLLKDKQKTCKNVLEVGIQRGGSIKMWNDYFVNANIYGFDHNDSPDFLKEFQRIQCFKINAYSGESIDYFVKNGIELDVALDDGPHTLESMIYFITNYSKIIANDGIMIIEDVQDIAWCEIFKTIVPYGFAYKIYDLRHIKNRYDDIVFVIKKNKPIVKKNNDVWVFYAFEGHNFKVLEDYIESLNERYNIVYTQDTDYVLSCNPKKITFVMNVSNEQIIEKYKNTHVELSILNTEPLTISHNLDLLKGYIYKYPYLKIYDYSFSNTQMLLNNRINAELLEYISSEKEIRRLKKLNASSEKMYDFGIITYGNTETNTIECLFHKKRDIVENLMRKGFKVHIISGWGEERDIELAKCKVILNIHSILGINGNMYYSKTFENIRCNRLLDSGFNILSEDSVYCNELVEKYPNLKFVAYSDFKNIEYSHEFWDKISSNSIKKYCFIHSCNLENAGTYRLQNLITKLVETKCIDVFDKIYINNIGLPIEKMSGDNIETMSKFEIINVSNDAQLFETPTINFMRDFSEKNPNSYILYLHTKGIRYANDDDKINDWINYMLYFLVDQHKNCLSLLDNYYDVVGCNYSNDLDKECFKYTNPFPPPHYSGNFWWANTNYLRLLPNLSLEDVERNAPELWLFKNNPVFYNLHSSNVNHYHNIYPKKEYIRILGSGKLYFFQNC